MLRLKLFHRNKNFQMTYTEEQEYPMTALPVFLYTSQPNMFFYFSMLRVTLALQNW